MEGGHSPETDMTRCHKVLEEGDEFESLFLRLDRCCFLALLRVDTHLLQTFLKAPSLPSVGFAFQEEKVSYIKATASSEESVHHGYEEG